MIVRINILIALTKQLEKDLTSAKHEIENTTNLHRSLFRQLQELVENGLLQTQDNLVNNQKESDHSNDRNLE